MSMTHAQHKQYFRTLTTRERVQLQQKQFKEQQLLRRLKKMVESAERESRELMNGTHHEQMVQLSIF